MVDEDEGQTVEEPVPAPRKRRRWPLLVGVVVLLAGAGGGYMWYAQHSAQAKAHADKQSAVKVVKAELYLPLEPAFVVNFRDEESMRYLQVGVTLMAHDDAAIATAKGAEPVIRDAMVSLLSSQDSTVISSIAGRQKLQAQALAAVQKVVQARLGRPGIDALYFTSFVMQ